MLFYWSNIIIGTYTRESLWQRRTNLLTFAKNEFVFPSFLSQFVKRQRNMYSTTQQLQTSIFWKEILFFISLTNIVIKIRTLLSCSAMGNISEFLYCEIPIPTITYQNSIQLVYRVKGSINTSKNIQYYYFFYSLPVTDL